MLSALCLGAFIYSVFGMSVHPQSILIIDLFLTMAFVGAARMSPRVVHEMLRPMSSRRDATRLVIIGAGDTGEALVHQIEYDESLRYQVVGFLDDDPAKRGTRIQGVPVLGPTGLLPKACAEDWASTRSIIAMPARERRARCGASSR